MIEKNGFLDKLKTLHKSVGHIYTLAVVYFGWILFKFSSMPYLGHVLLGMFGLNKNGFINMEVKVNIQNNFFFMIAAVIACTPLLKNAYHKGRKKFGRILAVRYIYMGIEVAGPVILVILATMALVGNSYNPFLYFQF